MPDNNKLKERFILNLKVGIPGVESSGGNYRAKNLSGSSGTGKYQFLKEWASKTGKVKGIKEFAQDLYGEMPKDQDGIMEFFRLNDQLQDDYFEYYAGNVLFEEAQELSKKNPENFSFDELGMIAHYQGFPKAKAQVSSGVLFPGSKEGVNGAKYDNMSGIDYINKVNSVLSNHKLEPISNSSFKTPEEKKKIIDNFKKQEEKINSMEVNPSSKELLRKDLYQKTYDQGDVEIVNDFIKERNAENQKSFNSRLELVKAFQDSKTTRYDVDTNVAGKKDKIYVDIKTDWTTKDLDEIKKNNPELAKYLHVQKKDGKSRFVVNQTANQGSRDNNTIPKFLEEFKTVNKDIIGDSKISLNDQKYSSIPGSALFQDIEDLFSSRVKRDGTINYEKLSDSTYQETQPIDVSNLKPKERIREDSKDDSKTTPEETTDKVDKETGKTEEDTTNGLASEFYKNELALGGVKGKEFNYTPGKRELPIDAIVGLSLGLIGNAQARDAKIPLRTEQVSEAIRNYTAELKGRSEQGLPVEVEAAMRNQLADAYQGGLSNIVNASAGNSATVLGNLGSLEASKNKGLVAIQVADYEAKDRAFAQYGKAIQYIDQFDANRDIANHGIKYGEAKTKQAEGKQLATAGFAKLIDAIKYDKENGPGSANDMYRSYLMQDMYGFDPKMKDNGLGDTPGTKSWYDADNARKKEEYGLLLNSHEKYNSLSPKAKSVMDIFVQNNKNTKDVSGMVDYLKSNPDADLTKFSMDNSEKAMSTGDMEYLFAGRGNNPKVDAILPNAEQTWGRGVQGIAAMKTQPIPQQEIQGLSSISNLTATPELATPGFNPDENITKVNY